MNNLDNFYNKKLQNRTFEFKDSYWEDAEQLIIADEKNRRKGLYFWLFGILFIVILAGSIYWIGLPQPESGKAVSAFLNSPVENQMQSDQNLKQDFNQSTDKLSKEENNLSEFNMINSDATISNDLSTDYSNNVIVNKIDASPEKSNPINHKENLSHSEKYTDPKDEKQSLADFSTGSKTTKENNQLVVFENDKTVNTKAESKNDETVSQKDDQSKVLSVPLLKTLETVWDKIESPEYAKLKKVRIPKTRNFGFGITASGLIYPAKQSEKAWIGVSFGLLGQYKILNALSLNAELLYTYRTGTFNAISKTTQTDYGFGKKTFDYSSKPESLHFVDFPVYVQYKSGRHRIDGGFTFSFLTGVRGNIEKQTSLLPWERTGESAFSNENLSRGWLYKSDFNSFNTSLLLGYRYDLNKNFGLGLRSSYRFGDLFKNIDSGKQALIESGPLHFNVLVSWYFLK